MPAFHLPPHTSRLAPPPRASSSWPPLTSPPSLFQYLLEHVKYLLNDPISIHDTAHDRNPHLYSNLTTLTPRKSSFEVTAQTSHNLYTALQKRMIQTVATATSAFTLVATMITFYWFVRMQKRLRHKLIMMSILGCFIRGLWYFIFSVVVMGNKPVSTHSMFCQTTGFFIALGNEITDFATLFIAIHGALQIFRPSLGDFDSGDGLYKYRRYVFGVTLFLPLTLASLAFTNQDAPYTSQGAFCALPTKPIWYRLGLSWIPRYIIGLTVTGLAIAVYVHVELKFRAFSEASRKASSMNQSLSGDATLGEGRNDEPESLTLDKEKAPFQDFLQAQDARPSTQKERRPSVPILRVPQYDSEGCRMVDATTAQRPKEVRINEPHQQDEMLQPMPLGKEFFPPQSSRKQSTATTASATLTTRSSRSRVSIPRRILGLSINPPPHSPSLPTSSPSTSSSKKKEDADTALTTQNNRTRTQLRRQLRLIFIYPIVYVVLWIPPLVLHIMGLFPDQSKGLPSGLAVTSTICLTLMGGVDCVVFLWREKPWRTGGGGNVLGAVRRENRGSGEGCLPPSFFGRWGRRKGKEGVDTADGSLDGRERDVEANSSQGSDARTASSSSGRGIPTSSTRPTSSSLTVPQNQNNLQIEDCEIDAITPLPPISPSQAKFPKRPKMSLKGSRGNSDKAVLARDRAYKRLALEMAERSQGRDSIGSRGSNGDGGGGEGTGVDNGVGSREWWDRKDSTAVVP